MRRTYIATFLLLTSCTVDRQLQATGGSKADGTVELSYELGAFQNARIDWAKADQDAAYRCSAWGYPAAEKFGGERRQCQYVDPSLGCTQWFVTVNYQCTGQKAAAQ